jgi:hypothetical protein
VSTQRRSPDNTHVTGLRLDPDERPVNGLRQVVAQRIAHAVGVTGPGGADPRC